MITGRQVLEGGFQAFMVNQTYQEKKEAGYSRGKALAYAGIDFFMYSTAMGPYTAFQMAPAIASLGMGAQSYYQQKQNFYRTAATPGLMGRGFLDTQQTATMRQRGVQAIMTSRMNARTALGNEASMMSGSVRY